MLSPESQKTYAVYVRSFIQRYLRAFKLHPRLVADVLLWGILVSLLYYITFAPPWTFPSGAMVKVAKGSSIEEIAENLQSKDIIRSVFLFEATARALGHKVIAGEYFFEEPENVLTIALRLSRGDYNLEPVRVTIPEGANAFEVTKLLSKSLGTDFDAKKFLELAEPKEGYLFPYTYFFYPGAEPELVIQTMTENFTRALATVSTSTVFSQKPLAEIVIMASLLEEEAAKSEDRRMIAGILWKRIELGIPLQVDAVFPYIIGKNTFTLTHADLKTDSPYNTYTNKGLPPGPITNPGLDSILAAMNPTTSTYLFYLSDHSGNFHFCATYVCHTANKAKYLD